MNKNAKQKTTNTRPEDLSHMISMLGKPGTRAYPRLTDQPVLLLMWAGGDVHEGSGGRSHATASVHTENY